MIGQPQGPYRVVPAGTIARQLRALAAQAAGLGMKEEFLAALREIAQRLARDPVSWGDHLWTSEVTGLENYHRLYQMLSIRYAVDRANKVVYWKQCRPVLSHPLAGP